MAELSRIEKKILKKVKNYFQIKISKVAKQNPFDRHSVYPENTITIITNLVNGIS